MYINLLPLLGCWSCMYIELLLLSFSFSLIMMILVLLLFLLLLLLLIMLFLLLLLFSICLRNIKKYVASCLFTRLLFTD